MYKVFLEEVQSYSSAKLQNFMDNFFSQKINIFKNVGRILLKPNILQGCAPEMAVTTHPEFIEKVISSIKKIRPFKIFLGDSPGANFSNYEEVLKKTGILEICNKHGVTIVKFENYPPLKFGDVIVSSVINEMDLIVNLPKLKTHSLTGLTLGVKNLFGLVPGTNKVTYHRNMPKDIMLAEAVYNIYKIVKDKTVCILDGIVAHEGDGPSKGRPVNLNVVMASECEVALDIGVCKVLGLDEEFCLTNKAALDEGFDKNLIQIDNPHVRRKIKLPVTKRFIKIPDKLKQILARKIYVKPYINKNCTTCLLCLKSCPVGAVQMDKDKKVFISSEKCVECFCCHEVCESGAIDLKRSFLHKVMIK